jgi:hypothetical protein
MAGLPSFADKRVGTQFGLQLFSSYESLLEKWGFQDLRLSIALR